MLSRRILLVGLCLAAALPAQAFDVSGSISSGYWRSDTWSGGIHDSAPALDYGGSLGFSATPFRKDLLQLTGGADYHQTHSYYSAGNSQTGIFTYSGSAAMFNGGPLSLNLGLARAQSDFTTDLGGATTGTTVTNSKTANASYVAEGLPRLLASFNRADVDNTGFAGLHHTYGYDSLGASAGQSIGPHHYNLGYDTSWNRGDLAENNYRMHHLVFQEGTRVGRDVDFDVMDNYLLRNPTQDSPVNPRIDANSLGTSVRWRPSSVVNTTTSYTYDHSLVTAAATPDRESSSQGLSVVGDYRYSRQLTLSTNASFNRGEERFGGASVKATGEALGAGAAWKSTLGAWQYNTSGTLTLGLYQASGTTAGAYGAAGSVGFSRAWDRYSASLSYGGSYSSNLAARAGSTFTHGLIGATDAVLWSAINLYSSLNLSSTRQDDPLLGASFSRSATLSSTLRYRKYNVAFQAGLTDGLAGRTQGGISDGLFIPVSYNTHSAFASISSGLAIARNLSGTAALHWVSYSAPQQASQHEEGFSLYLSYLVGSFTFTAEDRYSQGGNSIWSQRGNYIGLRATRSFGAQF